MTGIPSWAVRGAKVVCTSESYRSNYTDEARCRPIKGRVYTIREARMRSGKPQVWLEEIVNRVRRGSEPSFHTARFRPLVTRSLEQDIAEHFAGHLHQRVPEKA